MTKYYIHKLGDRITRLAKIDSGSAYGYENGRWVSMPGLVKIKFEVTDYEEISEEEAKKIMGE